MDHNQKGALTQRKADRACRKGNGKGVTNSVWGVNRPAKNSLGEGKHRMSGRMKDRRISKGGSRLNSGKNRTVMFLPQ